MTTLTPRNGCRYLNSAEIVWRLERAFTYVEATPDGARARVQEWMSQLAFVAAEGGPAAYDGDLARLRDVRDAALYVHFADDLDSEDALVSMLLIPGEPLRVEPLPQAPDGKSDAMIARCAEVLGYEIADRE